MRNDIETRIPRRRPTKCHLDQDKRRPEENTILSTVPLTKLKILPLSKLQRSPRFSRICCILASFRQTRAFFTWSSALHTIITKTDRNDRSKNPISKVFDSMLRIPILFSIVQLIATLDFDAPFKAILDFSNF